MEFFTRLVSPDSGSPLLFTQSNFWIFFGVVLFIFSIVHKRISLRNLVLAIVSLFFYYRAGGMFCLLLLIVILVNYLLAGLSSMLNVKRQRFFILLFSLFFNLGLLIYFKYSAFFISMMNSVLGISLDPTGVFIRGISLRGIFSTADDLIIPVGISFFTFQVVSYSIEVYRKKIRAVRNIIDFACYISFFPNLISGPLVKPQEFLPQLRQSYRLNHEEAGQAIWLILIGLIKKIIIADFLSANLVGRVFENPHLFTGFETLLAVYGYAFQIYFDFSGYTDMAIGLALLLGFSLPPNFNAPYRARNISEFWKRWHISLTTWFRDYVFLPLAYWLSSKMHRNRYFGLRSEKWIYVAGIFVTFILCGTWHGAAINFVIWGGLHGLALIIHKFVFPKTRGTRSFTFRTFLSVFITFHFIVFSWIIFRVNNYDSFLVMMRKIVFSMHIELIPAMVASYWKIVIILITAGCIIWFPEKMKHRISEKFIKCPEPVKVLLTLIVIIFVYQFKVAGIQSFIYFQF
jgi:alginate O-acetyltransferase complex protein AlgI